MTNKRLKLFMATLLLEPSAAPPYPNITYSVRAHSQTPTFLVFRPIWSLVVDVNLAAILPRPMYLPYTRYFRPFNLVLTDDQACLSVTQRSALEPKLVHWG